MGVSLRRDNHLLLGCPLHGALGEDSLANVVGLRCCHVDHLSVAEVRRFLDQRLLRLLQHLLRVKAVVSIVLHLVLLLLLCLPDLLDLLRIVQRWVTLEQVVYVND